MRMPTGEYGVGFSLEAAQRLQHLVAIGLQRVHPEIDGSAAGERRPLLARARAEGSAELRLEPFRIVAPHISGRVGGNFSPEPGKLGSDKGSGAWGPAPARAATSSGLKRQLVTSVRSTSARGLASPMA